MQSYGNHRSPRDVRIAWLDKLHPLCTVHTLSATLMHVSAAFGSSSDRRALFPGNGNGVAGDLQLTWLSVYLFRDEY